LVCLIETKDKINALVWFGNIARHFLNQVRCNSKRHAVTVAFLYRANDARTHAYDLFGFYHKEKRSTLVCDLV